MALAKAVWDTGGMEPTGFGRAFRPHRLGCPLTVAGGAVLTRLQMEAVSFVYADPVGGIGGTGMIAVVLLSLRLLLTAPAPVEEHITTENIEAHIRMWLDSFGVAVKRGPPDADTYFKYGVTLADGNPVAITRAKSRDHYIQLLVKITVSPGHKAIINRMSPAQLTRLADQVELELSRSGIGRTLLGPPLESVVLMKSIPISDSLSESVFAANLDQMTS